MKHRRNNKSNIFLVFVKFVNECFAFFLIFFEISSENKKKKGKSSYHLKMPLVLYSRTLGMIPEYVTKVWWWKLFHLKVSFFLVFAWNFNRKQEKKRQSSHHLKITLVLYSQELDDLMVMVMMVLPKIVWKTRKQSNNTNNKIQTTQTAEATKVNKKKTTTKQCIR